MMAMARSLTARLFFFLVVLASTARAARDLPKATSNLDEACDETRFPDLCARSLMAYPESSTASPRRLAELSVLAALDAGHAAAEFAHDAIVLNDDDGGELFRCLNACSGDVEEAVAQLSALSREPTDTRFLDVKAWLSATLDAEANYEAVCKDAPAGEVKRAAVARSVEFDMMLRVALDLIAEASASMASSESGSGDDSAEFLPSEQDATSPTYGGAAFGGGAPSPSYDGGDTPSYGHRRPRPRPRRAPAPAPARGYSHRRPRPRRAPAPAPAPLGAGYGAGMKPRAPAPAPFGGYGHRRPRPHPRAPVPAPAPLGAGYGAGMTPRAPSPAPFGGYGHRRPRPHPRPPPSRRPRHSPAPSPRAPAPAPFMSYAVPAPAPFVPNAAPARAPAYGRRRPRAPAPKSGPSRPPKPAAYSIMFGTDETE